MPANRSRTDNWRRSLRNIQERNGALEISLPRFFAGGNPDGADEETGSNLIWRVRIIELSDEEIIVEQPSALGQTIPIEDKVELIGVIAVGQNRWMFKTVNLGRCKVQLNAQRETVCLRLRMPVHVERCQRRAFYRIATVGLVLPEVRVWPVLDPLTIPAAEAASRARVQMHEDGQVIGAIGQA
ncbi:MAG: hypothetical protein VYC34_11310, partial [Planctomycetota bacterium]|nr:hypothetical protein [Planctomycetota bacterium]